MKRLGSDIGANQTFVVPDNASSILAFSCQGSGYTDALGSDIPPRAYLGNDLTENAGLFETGSGRSQLCIANTQFPPIPVQPGEKLLVAFTGNASAVIYFDGPS